MRVLIRGNCCARLLACCTPTQSRTRWQSADAQLDDGLQRPRRFVGSSTGARCAHEPIGPPLKRTAAGGLIHNGRELGLSRIVPMAVDGNDTENHHLLAAMRCHVQLGPGAPGIAIANEAAAIAP